MRKPKRAKGMVLISETKRPPRKLLRCLQAKSRYRTGPARRKWTVDWNHRTRRFEIWAKPDVVGRCGR